MQRLPNWCYWCKMNQSHKRHIAIYLKLQRIQLHKSEMSPVHVWVAWLIAGREESEWDMTLINSQPEWQSVRHTPQQKAERSAQLVCTAIHLPRNGNEFSVLPMNSCMGGKKCKNLWTVKKIKFLDLNPDLHQNLRGSLTGLQPKLLGGRSIREKLLRCRELPPMEADWAQVNMPSWLTAAGVPDETTLGLFCGRDKEKQIAGLLFGCPVTRMIHLAASPASATSSW